MTTVPDEPESNDASIEALLREVGARDEPSAATASEVMSAVHAEWLTIVQQRRHQQRVVAWRVAAGVGTRCIGLHFRLSIPGARARAGGQHRRTSTVTCWPAATTTPSDLAPPGNSIRVGDIMQTDAQSRAAVSFPDGLSLRLDHGTRLTVDATDRITLDAGAVYRRASRPARRQRSDGRHERGIGPAPRHSI